MGGDCREASTKSAQAGGSDSYSEKPCRLVQVQVPPDGVTEARMGASADEGQVTNLTFCFQTAGEADAKRRMEACLEARLNSQSQPTSRRPSAGRPSAFLDPCSWFAPGGQPEGITPFSGSDLRPSPHCTMVESCVRREAKVR
jgi:hypothetical protein